MTHRGIEVVDRVVVQEQGRRGHGHGDNDGPEDVLRRGRVLLSDVLPAVETRLRAEGAEVVNGGLQTERLLPLQHPFPAFPARLLVLEKVAS